MKQEVIRLIAREANRGQNDFDDNASLEDDLGLEDLDLLSLQLAIEDELEVTLDDKPWSRCKTVQDVIDLVGHQLATH
jgi:acyl carrier protein